MTNTWHLYSLNDLYDFIRRLWLRTNDFWKVLVGQLSVRKTYWTQWTSEGFGWVIKSQGDSSLYPALVSQPQRVNGRWSQQASAPAWTIRRVRNSACAETSFPLYICLASAAFQKGRGSVLFIRVTVCPSSYQELILAGSHIRDFSYRTVRVGLSLKASCAS